MQEEVTRKTVALSVETGKMTAHVLQKAMKKVLEDMAKAKNQPRLHHGKQSLRQLRRQLHFPVNETFFFLRDIELHLNVPFSVFHALPPFSIRVWDYPNK